MKKIILYIHGKGGNHLEAEQYKDVCPDFDVIGLDYEDYFPWVIESKFNKVYDDLQKSYENIYIIANSIGAYFTMHSLKNRKIEKALFISPILDMEKLILDMLTWANTTEEQLYQKGEIHTNFGETLSWEYLTFVRNNPINWNIRTEILYGENDNLTSIQTVETFVKKHDSSLTVLKDGEHWFHTDKQMNFLYNWVKKVI